MKTLFALLSLVVAANVLANEVTAVVGIGGCDNDESLIRATQALRDALARLPDAKVQSLKATAQPFGGLQGATSLADAQRVIEKAWLDHAQARFVEAERALEEALLALQTIAPSTERWRTQERALLLLGLMQFKQGKREAAKGTLARVLRIEDTGFQVGHEFPPAYRDLAKEVGAKLSRAGTLAVSTRPKDAQVFIDGRDFRSPVVRSVPPGSYRVESSFGGRRGSPNTVEVTSSASVVVDADLEVFPDLGPCVSTAEPSRQSRLSAMLRVGAKLGVSSLVGAWQEKVGDERYFVASALDLKTGQQAREGRIKLPASGVAPDIDRLASFIQTGAPPLETAVAPPGAKPPASSPQEPESASGASKGLAPIRIGGLVAAGGAVVALAAGGTFFLLGNGTGGKIGQLQSAKGGPLPPSSQAQVASLATTYRGQETAAGVLATVGVVAAVTAVVLFLVPSGKASGPGDSSAGLSPGALSIHF